MLRSLSVRIVTILLTLAFASSLTNTPHVFATEGTCSSHGGVNCSVGPDWDESSICNDGWTDSGERYFQQIECQKTQMCTESQWIEMSGTYVMKTDRTRFSSLINEINTLNLEYPMIEIRIQQEFAGRGVTTGGIAPFIQEAQKANRDGVATTTYAAQILDQKLRSAQMIINKQCIAAGLANQLSDNFKCPSNSITSDNKCVCPNGTNWDGSSCVAIAQSQPTQQVTLADPYAGITQDERCIKLGYGTFYNTDKQSCDTCPSGTTRLRGTNICQKPISIIPTTKPEDSFLNGIQATPGFKAAIFATTTSQATTTQATTSPKMNPKTPKSTTFWQNVASPLKSFWGLFFR